MARVAIAERIRGCCRPTPAPLEGPVAEPIVTALKALADETRLQVVSMLKRAPEPICVCDLTGAFGLSQPTISHHMARLRDAGLVRSERRGIWAYYSLAELDPPLRDLVAAVP